MVMKKYGILILSFVGVISVLSQTETYEDINLKLNELVSEQQYDFEPDEDSPDVEVAPLDVNNQDQDVPIPEDDVSEDVNVEIEDEMPNNQN